MTSHSPNRVPRLIQAPSRGKGGRPACGGSDSPSFFFFKSLGVLPNFVRLSCAVCPTFEAAESGPPGCSWRTYRRFSAARGIVPPICHFPFPRKVNGSHTHLRGKCLLLFAGRLIRRAVANGNRIDHFWVHSGSGEPGITPSRRVLAENGLVLDRD